MRTANMSAGQGSDPEMRDAEQLAAAIEQGRSPELVGDPTLARDLSIVELLRVHGPDPRLDPTAEAKARARARLRAAMAQSAAPAEFTAPLAALSGRDDAVETTEFRRPTVDEPVDDVPAVTAPDVASPRSRRRSRHSLPSRPAGHAGAASRPAARSLRRRVALVAVASLVALVAIAVGGDLASRNSLPGDALYALKRVSENVGVALTFDEQARAQRHLELATARVDEVEQLVNRDPAREIDAATVEDTITEFDTATGAGSRALLAAQDASGPAVLGDLQAWASDQAARLSVLRSSLPEPAIGEVDDSIALLDRLVGRTEALEARSECSEVTSSVVDDLGPLAAEGSCSPRPSTDPRGAAPESGSADVTQEGSTAPTTSEDGTPGPTTGGTATSTEPGLLPELGPDGLPLPDADVPASGDNPSDSGDGGEVSLPLPLLPPIQLPPLLPGLPGVSIG